MADPTCNIRANWGTLEHSTIIEKEQRFSRTLSGKSWKSKADEETIRKVKTDWYHNIFDGIPFFRGLGGSERVEYGYTYAGYLPVQCTSISPDRETKVIRRYWIVDNDETARRVYKLDWKEDVA